MYNSKFLELIISLDEDEQKQLLKFLPFSTLSNYTTIHKLIDYTIQQINGRKKEENVLKKENVYNYIFPKETYKEQKINKLISDCNKAIEGYIIYKSIAKDTIYHKFALIDFYDKKGMDKFFELELKQTETYIHSMDESLKKLWFIIELNEKAFFHETIKNNRQSNFQQVFDSVRNYSQLAEIKYRNFALINMNSDLKQKECSNILFHIHHNIHQLLNNHTSINEFEECYNLIQEYKNKILLDELKDCLILLISIAIWQVNENLENALNRLFNLYIFLIDNNLIFEQDNTIATGHYKNITTVGLYLNKLDYVDNFIETYKNNLPEDIREDIYYYNKAHLLYYKKEYDEVLQLISTTKYKDVFYRLSSRVLLIKTYYELEKADDTYFDILNNSINAFKKYVYTNEELNDYYKTRYKNFIKSVTKLIQLDNDKNLINKFMEELDSNKDVLEQKWLLEKAKEKL